MKYLRVYAGPDGETHLEDIDQPVVAQEVASTSSDVIAAGESRLNRMAADYKPYWHSAPRRQFVVTLSGSWITRTSDGATRKLGPGSVALYEDIASKGHINELLDGAVDRLFIRID